MSSRPKHIVKYRCCTASIRDCELLIAKNVFRYFHIERKLQQKLAIKQTEIITKINSEICAKAANDFLLIKQSEIGVKTIQIPSGISLKIHDEKNKNVVATPPKIIPDQIKPFNVELNSMISSNSLKKSEKTLSNLSEMKEIVKSYEIKNIPASKPIASNTTLNMTVVAQSKPNEIKFSPLASNELVGKINVTQQTTFAEKLNKKNENIQKIKTLLETQKDMIDIQTEPIVSKKNQEQKVIASESLNLNPKKDGEDKKLDTVLILEPQIKWKDIRLINSMNFIPKQSILKNYDDNIISQIRYIIHRFYLKYGRAPNIKNICSVIKLLCNIQTDHTDLIYRIITECCGFFQQRAFMNPIFFERRYVTETRLKYLNKLEEYRKKKYKIFYLYIRYNYAKSQSWVNVIESILTKSKTNCNQLVAIAQIASEECGLLPQHTKIFQCTQYECINTVEFETWLDHTLKIFVPIDKCVLILGEHVPFYTKFGKHPNIGSWNMSDKEEWFKERGNYTLFEESSDKIIARYVRLQEKYEKKIKLLYIPLLHFELNPIKYFWVALLKTFNQRVSNNVGKFQSLEDSVKFQMFKKIFATVENNNFKHYLKKVSEVERFYIKSTPLLMEGDIQRNSLQFDLETRKQNSLKRRHGHIKGNIENSGQTESKKIKFAGNKNNTALQNKIEPVTKSNNLSKSSKISNNHPGSSNRPSNTKLTNILPTKSNSELTKTIIPRKSNIELTKTILPKKSNIELAKTKLTPEKTTNKLITTFKNTSTLKESIPGPSNWPKNLMVSKNGKKIGPKSFMNKPSTSTNAQSSTSTIVQPSTSTNAQPSKSGILFIEKESIPKASTSLIDADDTTDIDYTDNCEMLFDNDEIKEENTVMDSNEDPDAIISNNENTISHSLKIKFVHSGVSVINQIPSRIINNNEITNIVAKKNETFTSPITELIQIKDEINYDEYDDADDQFQNLENDFNQFD